LYLLVSVALNDGAAGFTALDAILATSQRLAAVSHDWHPPRADASDQVLSRYLCADNG